jgi:hypothetical protein
MMSKNAIAIFEADLSNIMSITIAMITKTPWTHAAIRVNDKWYDSSETRGYFAELEVNEYKNRWCIIAEFDGELTDWLYSMKGKKYNWKGIYQFPFYFIRNRNKSHFYCFQAAWDAVWYSVYNEHFTPPKVSGESLKHLMVSMTNTTAFVYKQGLK